MNKWEFLSFRGKSGLIPYYLITLGGKNAADKLHLIFFFLPQRLVISARANTLETAYISTRVVFLMDFS